MTTFDQFAKTGASISVIWSTSSGADNYTIKVTPPIMPGQSDFTTTATSLQLIIVYSINYSINITAQNCAGSNSTIVPLVVGEVMEYLYICPNYAKKKNSRYSILYQPLIILKRVAHYSQPEIYYSDSNQHGYGKRVYGTLL